MRDVVYIDKIESHQPLQMYSRVGRRAPAPEGLHTLDPDRALGSPAGAGADPERRPLAAPLYDHTRRVVASLGIAGPVVRFADERVPRLAALVREAAADASRALGGADVGRD